MQIISNFNDYYDSFQAHGLDKKMVFKRQSESYEGPVSLQLPERLAFIREFLLSRTPSNIKVATRTCTALTATHGAVVFAGKIYPFVEVKAYPKSEDKKTVVDHVYTNEALNAFFLRNGADLDKKKVQFFFDRKTKPNRPNFFAMHGSCELMGKATEHGIGIATYRKIEVEDREAPQHALEVNPRLATLSFAKTVDSMQAYQELAMFFGNIAAPEKPMVNLSDKERHAKHGFDHWSFRKKPENI